MDKFEKTQRYTNAICLPCSLCWGSMAKCWPLSADYGYHSAPSSVVLAFLQAAVDGSLHPPVRFHPHPMNTANRTGNMRPQLYAKNYRELRKSGIRRDGLLQGRAH